MTYLVSSSSAVEEGWSILTIGKYMKEITATIIKELAPVMSPKEIQKEYGINFNSVYYYCNKYGIPKYREYRQHLREDFEKEYKALLEDIKIMRQQRVKALLDEQGI